MKSEVSALEELSRKLFVEAVDLHTMEEKLEWSTTWQGKYFNFLGYFFSIYCMWKIFIVSFFYYPTIMLFIYYIFSMISHRARSTLYSIVSAKWIR